MIRQACISLFLLLPPLIKFNELFLVHISKLIKSLFTLREIFVALQLRRRVNKNGSWERLHKMLKPEAFSCAEILRFTTKLCATCYHYYYYYYCILLFSSIQVSRIKLRNTMLIEGKQPDIPNPQAVFIYLHSTREMLPWDVQLDPSNSIRPFLSLLALELEPSPWTIPKPETT